MRRVSVWLLAVAALAAPSAACATDSSGCKGAECVKAKTSATATQAQAPTPVPTRTIYVAPDGNDAAAGTAQAPLKTVSQALGLAQGGERIVVQPGSYAAAKDSKARTTPVVIEGAPGGARPVIAGLSLSGGQMVTLRNLAFTGTLEIWNHPVLKNQQVAHGIVVENSDFTDPSAVCITVHGNAYDVTLRGNVIHNCASGLTGPNGDGRSHDIVVSGNRFENFTVDAMQFGHWDNVTIEDNRMSGARDPKGLAHNDLIQFTGDTNGVFIRRNILHDTSQSIFLKPDFGTIANVTIESNLVYDSRSFAVTFLGVQHVRFVNNTVWGVLYDALRIVGPAGGPGIASARPLLDITVANNILQGITRTDGAGNELLVNNLTPSRTTGADGSNLVGDPHFVNPAGGDYTPGPQSPAVGRAAANLAPPFDVLGRRRAPLPTVGALEADLTPPALGSLKAGRGPGRKRAVRVNFVASEPGQATIQVYRRLGRRYRLVNVRRVSVGAGTRQVSIARDALGHRLHAGRYRVRVQMTDLVGNVGKAKRATFTMK